MSEQPVLVREHYRGGGGGGSAPPPGDGAPPPDTGGGGGGVMSARWGPLPVWGWLVVGGVLAVGAYFWIRHGQAGAAAASTAASQSQAGSTAGTATDTGCYDSSGNSVPCSEADYASEIAGLQSEIDNMQGGASTPVSTAGAGSTMQVTVPDVVGDAAVQARATVRAAGLVPVVQGGSSRGQGTVSAQSPPAGNVASFGDTVTLSVTSAASAKATTATTTTT